MGSLGNEEVERPAGRRLPGRRASIRVFDHSRGLPRTARTHDHKNESATPKGGGSRRSIGVMGRARLGTTHCIRSRITFGSLAITRGARGRDAGRPTARAPPERAPSRTTRAIPCVKRRAVCTKIHHDFTRSLETRRPEPIEPGRSLGIDAGMPRSSARDHGPRPQTGGAGRSRSARRRASRRARPPVRAEGGRGSNARRPRG